MKTRRASLPRSRAESHFATRPGSVTSPRVETMAGRWKPARPGCLAVAVARHSPQPMIWRRGGSRIRAPHPPRSGAGPGGRGGTPARPGLGGGGGAPPLAAADDLGAGGLEDPGPAPAPFGVRALQPSALRVPLVVDDPEVARVGPCHVVAAPAARAPDEVAPLVAPGVEGVDPAPPEGGRRDEKAEGVVEAGRPVLQEVHRVALVPHDRRPGIDVVPDRDAD